ncbi:hypothetical protein LPJ56_003375 [Coemansia sp. RSA 2599]|nr:hypothetical protein LPJ56_003375 [Coemansia sp. RSA 2599]
MDAFEKELNAYLETSARGGDSSVLRQCQANTASQRLTNGSCPDGFEVSADPRYAYNQSSGQWLDLNTGVYSYYDAETQTYVPVPAAPDVLDSSESDIDGVVRLVVLRSSCFAVGHYVDIGAVEKLGIGRDWPEDSSQFLRIPEVSVSRSHALVFLGKVVHENENEREQSCLADTMDAGSEDGEIEDTLDDDDAHSNSDSVSTDLSEGECPRTHSQSPELPQSGDSNEPKAYVVDHGSTHGTFVNGKRVSESKTASIPHPLSHLDLIEIGETQLQIHIHGQWACASCSSTGDNEIQTTNGSSNRPLDGKAGSNAAASSRPSARHGCDVRQARIEELNAIKLKYMPLPRAAAQRQDQGGRRSASSNKWGSRYQDRAKARRQIQSQLADTKGAQLSGTACLPARASDSKATVRQSASAVPAGSAPISKDNQGFSMLQRMGWVPGSGLGSDSGGIADPIEIEGNSARAGLGSSANKSAGIEDDDDRRARLARITKERFDQL